MKFGKTSTARMKGLVPRLVDILNDAIKITKQDFSIISGLRTADEQAKIYASGNSELDGYKYRSAHQDGKAVDIAPYINGKVVFELDGYEKEWMEIGRAMLRVAKKHDVVLEWGLAYNIGNGYDQGHFQVGDDV